MSNTFGDETSQRITSITISEDDSNWITRSDTGDFTLWDYQDELIMNEEI